MEIPEVDPAVIDSIRRAATNIEKHLFSLGLRPVVSFEIETREDLEDGDDRFVVVAMVSSAAPPVPQDKKHILYIEELRVLFAVHRKYPRVLVYAKNTNGLSAAGWVLAKTLLPPQATTAALTTAAELALSEARKYEPIHEQT